MATAPDRVSLDINEHDAREAEATKTWAACEPAATADLKKLLLRAEAPFEALSIDTSLDLFTNAFADYFGPDWQAFRDALGDGKGRDNAELGRLVRKAVERAAEDYITSRPGQDWVARRVFEIDQDKRSERYS